MTTPRVRYQTFEFGKTDIHVKTLRNRQEYSDPEHIAERLGISSANWSLFGVVWAAGEILARLMHDYDIEGLRILEVGCGIGLASLVLNERYANITATDRHPEAEKFLASNAKLNDGKVIPFVRTGWADEVSDLGNFDLIIGADLLYEIDHADELAHFINQHAKPICQVIIIDPFRKHYVQFSKQMVEFGYDYHCEEFLDYKLITQPNRGCSRFNALFYRRNS